MVKRLLSSSLAGLPSEAEQQKRSRAVERKNHTESSLHNVHVLFVQDKQFAQCMCCLCKESTLHRVGVKNVDCGVCRIVQCRRFQWTNVCTDVLPLKEWIARSSH